MDNLEKFIKDNREKLDKYEPPENGWRRIKKGLPIVRKSISFWLSAAAVTIAILGTSITIYSVYQKANYSIESTGQTALKETEAYYNSLVNTLYREAKPFLTGQPEIAAELNIGIAQLDSICTDIRKDLKDYVSNQEVIEALIMNYRIKLQLLEDMLSMLKQNDNKSDKPESHEL